MNNETQLAKWRVKFESGFQYKPTVDDFGDYFDNTQIMWQGYLRAKQESEQFMKLAKFGAMVCSANKIIELPAMAENCGIYAKGKLTPNIEATIKELLND